MTTINPSRCGFVCKSEMLVSLKSYVTICLREPTGSIECVLLNVESLCCYLQNI